MGEETKWWKTFKKFILERPELFDGENAKKQTKNFLAWDDESGTLEFSKKNCNSIYIIHALKTEFISKFVDEPEQSIDDIASSDEVEEVTKNSFDVDEYLKELVQNGGITTSDGEILSYPDEN